jgi:uncharacterized protein (TIGR02285 family)
LSDFLRADPDRRIGVMALRSYGPRIDSTLKDSNAQVQALRLTGNNMQLMTMVAKRHGIDATLAYGFELSYLESTRPELKGQLTWLPLDEQPRTLLGYVACARSPAGQRTIDAVNQVLSHPQERLKAQLHYEAWLDPASRAWLAEQRRAATSLEAFWTVDGN